MQTKFLPEGMSGMNEPALSKVDFADKRIEFWEQQVFNNEGTP